MSVKKAPKIINLRNEKAQALLDTGKYELESYTVYAVRNKETGNREWVSSDFSNDLPDKYICVTDMETKMVACHRDKMADNPFSRAMNKVRNKFNLVGKEIEKVASYLIENKITVITDIVLREIAKLLKR